MIGKSGTGKSFQAISLCESMGIESIIDDGLFIKGGTVLAGISAKRQLTTVGAIKTALFTEDEHRDAVAKAIRDSAPGSILVLGTSDRMVEKITSRLGLEMPEELIDIESLTTPDERKLAGYRRHELGQHVIPAPTFEVKRGFSGYFLHPLKVLQDIRNGRAGTTERSVVRPTYSYFGNYTISTNAIINIVHAVARRVPAVESLSSVFVRKRQDGIIIDAGIIVHAGHSILDAARDFQIAVREEIEAMTAMNVLGADVEITELDYGDMPRN
ncbi:hypothetical protein AGMMS49983_07240 [Clostridia bacterium]|nr:hypothetical protein AGMMS49983_07240 [Clostridia bacterium]